MRKTTVALLAALFMVFPGTVFAQEDQGLSVSGEVKTGLYMEQEQIGKADPVPTGGMTNNDGNSGTGEGRFRMDMNYALGNVGLRVRFQVDPSGTGPFLPVWSYAYAYGNLLNDQLTISGGLLGNSPWGTGGSKLWQDPETRLYSGANHLSREPYTVSEALIGVRFEYKPSFLPGLNVGFVLNQPDQTTGSVQEQTFIDILKETVIGVAYENDYFAVRVGFRLDGAADTYASTNTEEGSRLTYRLEERLLKDREMQIWLNGVYYGLGNAHKLYDEMVDGVQKRVEHGSGEYFINWLYWLWDTDSFIAKLDVGFSMYKEYLNGAFYPDRRQEYMSVEFQPAFSYNFLDNFLQAGVGFGFGMEFGEGKTYKDAPYQYYFVEPQVRLNIGSNAYLALVYNFTDKYAWPEGAINIPGKDPYDIQPGDKSQKHSINLRAVYTF
jgi:hypothetical protein